MAETIACPWVDSQNVDLSDGSTLTVTTNGAEVAVSRSFGPDHRDWIRLGTAEETATGLVLDCSMLGWVALLVHSLDALFVFDTSVDLSMEMRLPLEREASGDRAFRRELMISCQDRFFVIEVETTVCVLDRRGRLRWLTPHYWPRTRITTCDEERLTIEDYDDSYEVDLVSGRTVAVGAGEKSGFVVRRGVAHDGPTQGVPL